MVNYFPLLRRWNKATKAEKQTFINGMIQLVGYTCTLVITSDSMPITIHIIAADKRSYHAFAMNSKGALATLDLVALGRDIDMGEDLDSDDSDLDEKQYVIKSTLSDRYNSIQGTGEYESEYDSDE